MHGLRLQMTKLPRPFLPPSRQGIIIDVIAIIANLILFPVLLTRVENLFNESFTDGSPAIVTLGFLMLFILAARLAGLYLKRFPLQTRLERSGQTSFPIYFFFLNFGVFVMNAAFVMVFVTSAAGSLGLIETNYSGQPRESLPLTLAGVFLILAMTAAEVYLIYRLSRPLTDRERKLHASGNWRYDWRGEFAADFGLFSYMMIWQVFYNNTAKVFMTPSPNTPETLQYKIFSAVFLFVVFLLFYVSPRTVFLIEDRKYIGTWVFIFGVYAASVLRYW
jgi:hypothetical protein